MFLATILVCVGLAESLTCDLTTASRTVNVPHVFPTRQICFLMAQQFAAQSADVPIGRLVLVCGPNYVKLESVPA